MWRNLATILMMATPAVAMAANEVSLTSTAYLQKEVVDAQGRRKIVLEDPKIVIPGNRVAFVLNYRNTGAKPATNFVITNPVPNGVTFTSADEPWAVVSVDGGAAWGALGTAKVKMPSGTLRPAQPSDVTHIRWVIKSPIPANGGGKVTFRAIVK
jgi:uncharacterized repeat protein (TIGR01451 family)